MLHFDYEEVHKTRGFCFRGRERTGTDVLSIYKRGKWEHFTIYYTVPLVICPHRLLAIGSENHLLNGSRQSRGYAKWYGYEHERYTFPNDDEYEQPWAA